MLKKFSVGGVVWYKVMSVSSLSEKESRESERELDKKKITYILEGDQGRKTQNKTKIKTPKITCILEGDQGRKTQIKSK